VSVYAPAFATYSFCLPMDELNWVAWMDCNA